MNKMKELIEDYKRRLETINNMIDVERDEIALGRLKTKRGMIRSFIVDLERLHDQSNNAESMQSQSKPTTEESGQATRQATGQADEH